MKARLERWIDRAWYPANAAGPPVGSSVLRLLTPLAWLFGTVVRLRRFAFSAGLAKARGVAVPVVVVGNITVGGTGKTPFTIWLARCLAAEGVRVGIVTRGYGAAIGRDVVRVTARSRPAAVGDEAVLLARRTGCLVAVGRDRVAAARLIEADVDLVLADDGLQHLRLRRDLEVVLVNASRGIGNGRLLPCGPLREPAARLRAADFVVVTGEAGRAAPATPQDPGAVQSGAFPVAGTLRSRLPDAHRVIRAGSVQGDAVSLAGRGRRPLAAFAGDSVHAVAGIADPERFFTRLRAAGIRVVPHPLPDHAAFDEGTLDFGDSSPVLMTEKDAVKCESFADERCWAVGLAIEVEVPGRERLLDAVRSLLSTN